ncbi:hypothetical protein C0J52_27734 [Blattella germanica]|nr:hypothetical protein C0J52_27734 [Blattella germanica]
MSLPRHLSTSKWSFVSSAFSLHMAWIVIRFLSGNKVPSVFRGSLYALCCSVLPVPPNGKRERLTITQMQMFMKWPRIAYLFKADVENDRLVLQDGSDFIHIFRFLLWHVRYYLAVHPQILKQIL